MRWRCRFKCMYVRARNTLSTLSFARCVCVCFSVCTTLSIIILLLLYYYFTFSLLFILFRSHRIIQLFHSPISCLAQPHYCRFITRKLTHTGPQHIYYTTYGEFQHIKLGTHYHKDSTLKFWKVLNVTLCLFLCLPLPLSICLYSLKFTITDFKHPEDAENLSLSLLSITPPLSPYVYPLSHSFTETPLPLSISLSQSVSPPLRLSLTQSLTHTDFNDSIFAMW